MWLYLPPSTFSPSSAEGEGSISGSDLLSRDPVLWVTSSAKPTPRLLSWPGWARRTWIRLLSGTMLSPLTADRFAASWIASLAASRAKTSPTPGSAVESKEAAAGSGFTSLASFARFNRATSSWKTSQLSLFAGSMSSSPTWPRSGSMRNGVCWERTPLELRTSEIASSSWPTPDATVSNGFNQSQSNGAAVRPHLAALAKTWSTPRVQCNVASVGAMEKYSSKPGLLQQVRAWPTPRASANENRTTQPAPSHGHGHGSTLAGEAGSWATPRSTDGSKGGPNARDSTGSPHLCSQAATWPTPTSRDWKDGACADSNVSTNGLLGRASVRWPTPTAELGKGYMSGTASDTWRPSLEQAALGARPSRQVPMIEKAGKPTSGSGRVLNPRFVEALMGWPIGWSDCDSSATELSRSKPPPHLACSGDGSMNDTQLPLSGPGKDEEGAA
jgi:hypothetical protein